MRDRGEALATPVAADVLDQRIREHNVEVLARNAVGRITGVADHALRLAHSARLPDVEEHEARRLEWGEAPRASRAPEV